MKTTLKFKCTLLSDVILNQKIASEGPNRTLDFIPGSNFLGIVAASVYSKTECDGNVDMALAQRLFHSGKVRFGDAHPLHKGSRSLRIPADLFFAKGQSEDGRVHYMHHAFYPDNIPDGVQLKQERAGFVDFSSSDGKAVRLKTHTNFSIKSAYDRLQRRSRDAMMFGYQSMEKGQEFCFSVELDEGLEGHVELITNALVGEKRIGRSRGAEYGLVSISSEDFNEVSCGDEETDLLVIYADSRLIFLDEYGMPTYNPDVSQLLGEGYYGDSVDESGAKTTGNASVLWEKSQIRTFRYAPYNYKRKCFDTDRCGIEKGSVIVVKLTESVKPSGLNSRIGSYLNEGFGKVIFNPSFLNANSDGKAPYSIVSEAPSDSVDKPTEKSNESPDSVLVSYVLKRKKMDEAYANGYELVNQWVSEHKNLFAGHEFASQFGNIRNLALKSKSKEDLQHKLFNGDRQDGTLQKSDKGYLAHGVAKDRWFGPRKNALEKFVNEHDPEYVVLLANAMQKECSMKKQGENRK